MAMDTGMDTELNKVKNKLLSEFAKFIIQNEPTIKSINDLISRKGSSKNTNCQLSPYEQKH